MASSRYKINHTPEGITVSARVVHDSQEIGSTAVFLIFSFALTCIAPFYLEEHYFTHFEAILIPLLFTFYLVGSLVYCLLWQLFGRENIKIRNHTLSHGYTLFSIGRWRSFPLSEISKWHSCDHIPKAPVAQGRKQRLPNVSLYQNGMKRKIHNIPNILRIQKCVQGAWAFDYQGKTIRIGDFFDSRDFQTVNIELNRFIPTSAKARQLKDAL
ncbi:TPA: hypothetical protein ACU8BF_000278 [Neisseria subflava]|nr:hypothetical protein [Neisseria lactamica]